MSDVSAAEARETSRFIFGYRDETTGAPRSPNRKQYLAHLSKAIWLLYGGAAGGGKSEWLIVEAIAHCLRYQGTDVALFRRTRVELEQSLIGRFLALVPSHIAKYNASKSYATFYRPGDRPGRPTGSKLWFCYCARERDVYRYQSAAWSFLGIDEGGHFTEFQFRYLTSRVRTRLRNVPLKIRIGANPGGVGHGWMKRLFITPTSEALGDRALPEIGEMWTPNPTPDYPKPVSRQFIQALLADNFALMESDPGYVDRLRELPEDEYRMLALGDWDVFAGQVFSMWKANHQVRASDQRLIDSGLRPGRTIPWHVIPDPTWEPPRGALIYGSVDYGYGNPWSFHLHAALPDGHVVTFKEAYAKRVRDVEQAKRIAGVFQRAWAEQRQHRLEPWNVQYVVMDTSMWGSRQEHGLTKSHAEIYDEILVPLGVQLQKSHSGPNSRIYGLQRIVDALMPAPDGFPSWQVTTACPNLIRTLPELPFDEDNPEDVDTEAEDHAYDDCRYFWSSRPVLPKRHLVESDGPWPLTAQKLKSRPRHTQRALGRSV